MAKIYTKTGDGGTTGLLGRGRVSKGDVRIEAYGTVDELNAAIGAARSADGAAAADGLLARLQHELFDAGAALADPDPDGPFHHMIVPAHAAGLERDIDAMEADLAPLTQFILPGGCPAAAQVHVARTVARRAERAAVRLAAEPGESVPEPLLIYLNRISDLLFVLARWINLKAGVPDVAWTKR